MSRRVLSEAEQWASYGASKYLERALRIVAEQCGRTSTHARDPGAVALEFPAIVAALIESQSRLYLATVINYGMEGISDQLGGAPGDLEARPTCVENGQSQGAA